MKITKGYLRQIIREEIEKEVNKIFRKISVVINQKEILCTNITGFKQLNGSKVEKSDLDYILNEAKSSVMKNQEKNSILPSASSMIFLNKSRFIVPIKPLFLFVKLLSVSKQKTHL